MAKSRYSLDETMYDAVQGIKEAKNSPVETAQSNEPGKGQEVASTKKEETKVQTTATSDATEKEVAKTEEDAGIGKSLSNKNINKHKKKVNQTAVDKESRNVRNVYLSDETLECLEMIKKELNSSRKSKDEPFVSAANLMNLAIEEYIDRNFPDVRKLYQMIRQMKLKP